MVTSKRILLGNLLCRSFLDSQTECCCFSAFSSCASFCPYPHVASPFCRFPSFPFRHGLVSPIPHLVFSSFSVQSILLLLLFYFLRSFLHYDRHTSSYGRILEASSQICNSQSFFTRSVLLQNVIGCEDEGKHEEEEEEERCMLLAESSQGLFGTPPNLLASNAKFPSLSSIVTHFISVVSFTLPSLYRIGFSPSSSSALIILLCFALLFFFFFSVVLCLAPVSLPFSFVCLLPPPFLDLITRLMNANPLTRANMAWVKAHPWYQAEILSPNELTDLLLSSRLIDCLTDWLIDWLIVDWLLIDCWVIDSAMCIF